MDEFEKMLISGHYHFSENWHIEWRSELRARLKKIDVDLDKYMEENKLPNEFKYFDPTKALENRECGLHA